MGMFSSVLDWLQGLPDPALLAVTGLLVAGEGVVGLGLVVPGEAALLIASAGVNTPGDFLSLWATATVSSIAGNVIGFTLGRHAGPALRNTKLIRNHGAQRWDRATALLRRHGTWAVFFGRLMPFVRSFVPAVAGAAGMSYFTFLPAVAAGAACATALPILFSMGVVAGVKDAGDVVTIVLATLFVAVVVVQVIRVLRKSARQPSPDRESALDEQIGTGEEARRPAE